MNVKEATDKRDACVQAGEGILAGYYEGVRIALAKEPKPKNLGSPIGNAMDRGYADYCT